MLLEIQKEPQKNFFNLLPAIKARLGQSLKKFISVSLILSIVFFI